MFRTTHQAGFLSILYACGSSPLAIWDQKVKNGHIRRVTDEDVKSLALEISGTNVATTYIICPGDPKQTLGIRLPFFVMIVKNLKRYFTFEIQILDDKNMSRRFRVSNYQSTTRVKPFCTTMPIGLSSGWNQIQFNLADFTRRAYGSTYLETMRVQIHANVRIRRIYFSDRLYSEDEMPKEYKLYLPIAETQKRGADRRGSKKEEKEYKDQATDVQSKMYLKDDVIPSGALPTPVPSERGIEKDEEVPGEGSPVAEEKEKTSVTSVKSAGVGEGEAIPQEGEGEAAPEGAEEGGEPAEAGEAPEAGGEPAEAPTESEAAEPTEPKEAAEGEAPPAEEAGDAGAPTEDTAPTADEAPPTADEDSPGPTDTEAPDVTTETDTENPPATDDESPVE